MDEYVCKLTGQLVDLGRVTVKARYADCSVFDCPACGQMNTDDRPGVHFLRRGEHTRFEAWGVL